MTMDAKTFAQEHTKFGGIRGVQKAHGMTYHAARKLYKEAEAQGLFVEKSDVLDEASSRDVELDERFRRLKAMLEEHVVARRMHVKSEGVSRNITRAGGSYMPSDSDFNAVEVRRSQASVVLADVRSNLKRALREGFMRDALGRRPVQGGRLPGNVPGGRRRADEERSAA